MIEATDLPQRLVIVDDDDLTRALLLMVAAEAGFACEDCSSGDAALAQLDSPAPHAILCDLQMPGTCGPELAAQLRARCGPKTFLLAMSGSAPSPETTSGYDGFLLKPFAAAALRQALEAVNPDGRPPAAAPPASPEESLPALDRGVYAKYSAAMPAAQVAGLYAMCLDDAEKRLVKMRLALADRDEAEWRSLAHAIKGGCGMVGALEMARLASLMERSGLPPVDDDAPLLRMMDAAGQLKRILDAP